jgi:hypothetical protein
VRRRGLKRLAMSGSQDYVLNMIADEIRARLRAQPFQPFTVVLADGEKVVVHHHDDAWLLSQGGEFYVEDTQGKVHHILTSHITLLIHDQAPGQSSVVPAG